MWSVAALSRGQVRQSPHDVLCSPRRKPALSSPYSKPFKGTFHLLLCSLVYRRNDCQIGQMTTASARMIAENNVTVAHAVNAQRSHLILYGFLCLEMHL